MGDEEGSSSDVRRSSRARGKPTKAQSALEILRETRKNNKVHKVNVDELVPTLYRNVDEDEYNKIVQDRQSNFVIDDGMGDYVDHGDDFFEEDEESENDMEPEKSKKKDKKEKKAKKGTLTKFFGYAPSKQTTKDESKVTIGDDDLLKSLLAGMNDEMVEEMKEEVSSPKVTNPFARSGTKRPADDSDTIARRPVAKKFASQIKKPVPKRTLDELSTSKKVETFTRTQQVREKSPESDIEIPDTMSPDFEDEPMEEEVVRKDIKEEVEVMEEEIEEPKVEVREIKAKKREVALSELNWDEEVEPTVDIEVKQGDEDFYCKTETGKSCIRMYWLDAYEDTVKNTGVVYLFGRVPTGKGHSASCCVVVKNIQHQVYVLPRPYRVVNGTTTSEEVSELEVFEELKEVLMHWRGLGAFKVKKTSKKFMNDGTVPDGAHLSETPLMEVRFEGSTSCLPSDLKGETFSAVFNTTTTKLERLLVEKSIMGPGWMDITNYEEVSAKQSYCDYEFSVDMSRMDNISYNSTHNAPVPTCKMLVVNVVTCLNGKDNEVCMISTLFNPNCDLNNPSVEQQHLQRFCLLTKPAQSSFPFDLKECLKSRNMMSFVQQTANEQGVLNLFLAKLQKWEPDIIVGHDLSATMEFLKARMQKFNIGSWSRTSRLKRSARLNTVKTNKAGMWELTAGRLLVDSKISATEMVRSRTFELSELATQLLNVERVNLYPDEVTAKYCNSVQLINLIQWSFMDPWYSLRIIAQLNALPLYMQITNIVGGVASRTLMGGRAERNEYLLLHSFHRGNIIAPDKYVPIYLRQEDKDKRTKDNTKGQPEDPENAKGKAQYAGGLVLEPKKGLYDTLILLLDFNSLYPSIIQEFNICFTTVKYQKDDNELPELPDSSLSEGILPLEIKGLVDRRKQVKSLMKAKDLSQDKYKQYDIRQMALKLTANSMYGCLGFQQSRFYAKPLAALITSKGRQILTQTRDLVEKMGYSVVYGDTDSIMINTNCTDLPAVKKLGNEIKKQVNQCFRLLELDLDGVFKRLLLLKKKKYAALTVNPDDPTELKKELKGLDIVRRDWSKLAKDAGIEVVDVILNPDLNHDEMVAEILDSLRRLRATLDKNAVDILSFQICKQLTRNPKEYRDIASQPHASVAMRLNESGQFNLKHGDIVEYIICDDGTTNPATQRAYHRTEMEKNSKLKIDLNYYLGQQVHPVVSRLCAPIEETDSVVIADALGMDASSYRRAAAATHTSASSDGAPQEEFSWSLAPNYDACKSFSFSCFNKCGHVIDLRQTFYNDGSKLIPSLDSCPECKNSLLPFSAFFVNQLRLFLTTDVQKYYNSPYTCDDATCNFTTSVVLKWGSETMDCPKCKTGTIKKEYSSKELYEQQSFFNHIFNIEKALEEAEPEQKKLVEVRYEKAINLSKELFETTNEFITFNQYNRVSLGHLFTSMKLGSQTMGADKELRQSYTRAIIQSNIFRS